MEISTKYMKIEIVKYIFKRILQTDLFSDGMYYEAYNEWNVLCGS